MRAETITQSVAVSVAVGLLALALGQARGEQGKAETAVPVDFETPSMPANPPASWLTYHLAHPGPGNAYPGDPNCAFYWKGRYHLHYIYQHKNGHSFAQTWGRFPHIP